MFFWVVVSFLLTMPVLAAPQKRVDLQWEASTDATSGVSHYQLYRDGAVIVPRVYGTGYTDRVSPGTYVYWVVAVDRAGNESEPSAPLTVEIRRGKRGKKK
jgi:hypothetical protein